MKVQHSFWSKWKLIKWSYKDCGNTRSEGHWTFEKMHHWIFWEGSQGETHFSRYQEMGLCFIEQSIWGEYVRHDWEFESFRIPKQEHC